MVTPKLNMPKYCQPIHIVTGEERIMIICWGWVVGGVRVSHGNEFSNRMTAGPGTAVAGDREAASKQDLLRI